MAKKILFSSVDGDGKPSSGFVEADSNSEALVKLRGMGHAEVQFFGDATMTPAGDQELLAPFDERSARFQIRMRHRPDFAAVLMQSLHNNKLNLLVGIGLLLYGGYFGNPIVTFSGIGILLLVPLVTAWKHRATRRYDRLLANFALGKWAEVIADVDWLRRHEVGSEMAFDLDLREAVARFRLDGDSDAADALEAWREPFDAEMPGYFESRMASLQHGLGHPDNYLALMREAFFKSSMSPLIIADLALAEARLGDVDKARTLLKNMPVETLPVEGAAFLLWTSGLIAYRSGSSGAREFAAALECFAGFGESPALWPAIAVCVGDWASHAADPEWMAHGIEEKLRAVWPVLEAQTEAETSARLSRRLSDRPS